MTTTLRVRFDGNVLVPVEPVDLPTDRELQIEVTDPSQPPKGSPEAIAKVIEALPTLAQEDVDEWERAIEEGKLPPSQGFSFDKDNA